MRTGHYTVLEIGCWLTENLGYQGDLGRIR